MNSIFIFLIFYQIFLVQAPIPNWILDSQSISTTSLNYIIYQSDGYNTNVKLEKKIYIENGQVTSKNILKVGTTEREVDFEDIDSHYSGAFSIGDEVLICPKGKFHPYKFNANSYYIPSDFVEAEDWNLKCYNHFSGHFLILYLPNNYYSFYSCTNCASNDGLKRFGNGNFANIYDFTLENKNNDLTYETNYQYMFPSLRKDDDKLKFYGLTLTMNDNAENIDCQNPAENTIIVDTKTHTQAFYEKGNSNGIHNFYYFTYNDISDFESGFY